MKNEDRQLLAMLSMLSIEMTGDLCRDTSYTRLAIT